MKEWGETVKKTESFGEFVISTIQPQPQADKLVHQFNTNPIVPSSICQDYASTDLQDGPCRGKDVMSLLTVAARLSESLDHLTCLG